MAIEFVQLSAATATDGALVAADFLDFGTATKVSVQVVKIGFGADGSYSGVESTVPLPVLPATTSTSPVSVGTWTATGQVLTSALASATQPVDVTNWSATDLNVNLAQTATVAITGTVSVATTATQPVTVQNTATVAISGTVEIGDWTATQGVFTSAMSTATQPVSLANTATVNVNAWNATDLNVNLAQTATVAITGNVSVATTATQPVTVQNTATVAISGNVTTVQGLDTATAHNVTTHPYGPYGNQVLSYETVTATTVATLATGPGSNNFNDLVALYVSNHATSPVSVSIRDTSTATLFNAEIAGDGGGFIWQPAKPTRQRTVNNAWTAQIGTAIATPGITITSQYQTAT